MPIDFRSELNAAQFQAVTAGDGPHLVIAAAGTGKTRTLVHRVAWLLQERQVFPRQIWLLTFTNRAASEMLQRAAALCPQAVDVPGGTFHHMANRILRRHAERLGYPRVFSILDAEDSVKLMRACATELGHKDKNFPKPAVLAAILSLSRNRCTSLDEDLDDRFGHLRTVSVDDIKAVIDLYDRRKHEAGAMDFDDLLVNAVRLLSEQPEVAAEYQNGIHYLLVDEYQDTNRIQSEFIDLLCKVHPNIMAVGDDFQSIYGWRGADVSHILAFEKRHPGARVIKLEENYRSAPAILTVANRVIAGNPEQYQKVLRPSRRIPNRPLCVSLADGRHQAYYVVQQLKRLLRNPDLRPRDIAILYRAHFHALDLQLELLRNPDLPFTITSGVSFYEQAHVKDLCAPLRLVANPRDLLAAQRLLELFPKIGPRKSAAIFNKLGGQLDFKSAAARHALLDLLPDVAHDAMAAFFAKLLPDGDHTPDAVAATCFDKAPDVVVAFLDAFYHNYLQMTFDNAQPREDDANALAEESARYPSTAAFIENIALLTNLDTRARAPGTDADAIRLSTIHQAKGLEWKVVFILWAVEGMLPSYRALEDDDLSAAGSLAEERRLFYVAVTRARDDLQILVPKTRHSRDGSLSFTTPSRFLDELEPAMLDHLEPPIPAALYPRRPHFGY